MPERVIFRTELNPYVDGPSYLAVFPDDPANPGMICCLPFHFVNTAAIFEPYTEASLGYYYDSTRIVHKDTDAAQKCLQAITSYYGSPFEFRIVERMAKK